MEDEPGASPPHSIPAGRDFFRTQPGTAFMFERFPIPAGFFSERSYPLAQVVRFKGRPLPNHYFGGLDILHVDTVVERKKPADLAPPYPCSARVPIELVGLALESVEPIPVQVGRRIELWDAIAEVSSTRPSQGWMTITKHNREGGTFDSALTVLPQITFLRRCDGKKRVIDVGALSLSDDLLAKLTLYSVNTPWRHTAKGILRLEGLNDHFVAGAPGHFEEDGEVSKHHVHEPPSCVVTIAPGPTCICLGQSRQYTAHGSPEGGSYSWDITGDGKSRARITAGPLAPTVTVEGTAVSGMANDIPLQVEYSLPVNGTTCTYTIGLTTIDATLTFRNSGMSWDPLNSISPELSHGHPQLGAVKPGDGPTGMCTGYFKNIELKAEIHPNDPALKCSFNFKRTLTGICGARDPSGSFMSAGCRFHCPGGPCDDNPAGNHQDVSLSTAGTIFNVDSPGWDFPATLAACFDPGVERISCLNFTEWLDADGQQCGRTVYWHANTHLRCVDGGWVEISPSVGEGFYACNLDDRTPGIRFDVGVLLRLLVSDSFRDQAIACKAILGAHESDRLNTEDRGELISGLLTIVREHRREGQSPSPVMLALELLGVLQAEQGIPALLQEVLTQFNFTSGDPQWTVAANALVRLGETTVPHVVQRANEADDLEWRTLERVLQSMKNQTSVCRVICEVLDSEPGLKAEDRLVGQDSVRSAVDGRV